MLSTPSIAGRTVTVPSQQTQPDSAGQVPSSKVIVMCKPKSLNQSSEVKALSRHCESPVAGFLEPDTSTKLVFEQKTLSTTVHVSFWMHLGLHAILPLI